MFTTIESKDTTDYDTQPSTQENPLEEAADAPPIPIRPQDPATMGSRTWSSHMKPIEPVAKVQPTSFGNLPTLPPLLFTLPTLPTLPPLIPANHLMKDSGSPMEPSKHAESDSFYSSFRPPLNMFTNRFQRSISSDDFVEFDDENGQPVREKRSDYYDQAEKETINENLNSGFLSRHGESRLSDDSEVGEYRSKTANFNRLSQVPNESYRKQSSYENCFKYLDRTEIRLFT